MMVKQSTYVTPSWETAISSALYAMFTGATTETIKIIRTRLAKQDVPSEWHVNCDSHEHAAVISLEGCMEFKVEIWYDEEKHLDNLDIGHL
jgi:hypothetical protein